MAAATSLGRTVQAIPQPVVAGNASTETPRPNGGIVHDLLQRNPDLIANEHTKKISMYQTLEKTASVVYWIIMVSLSVALCLVVPLAAMPLATLSVMGFYPLKECLFPPLRIKHERLRDIEWLVAEKFRGVVNFSREETLHFLEASGVRYGVAHLNPPLRTLMIHGDLLGRDHLPVLKRALARIRYLAETRAREQTADSGRILKIREAFVQCLLMNPYTKAQLKDLVSLSKGLGSIEHVQPMSSRTTSTFLMLRNPQRTTLSDDQIDQMSTAQLASRLETAIRA